MLKALVQLFAETFLQSKKLYISQQSNLSSNITNINLPGLVKGEDDVWNIDYSFIAPNDGWVFCAKWPVYALAVVNTTKGEMSNGIFWGFKTEADRRAFIPCCKGDSVRILIKSKSGDDVKGFTRFIPKLGSI